MKRLVLIGICFLFIGLFGSTAKAQAGCQNYLGRANEKICEKKTGYDECVVKLKKGEFNFCGMYGKNETWIRRITPEEAVSDLNGRGCTVKSDGGFACSEVADFNVCLSYKNFGSLKSCDKTPPQASNGNLYVYGVGADNAMWSIKSTNGKWAGWQNLGGDLRGGIDACSPKSGKIITMFRANDGATIWQAVFDYTNSRGAWSNLYSKIGSDPSVTCGAGDKVWLFTKGFGDMAVYGNGAEKGVWANLWNTDSLAGGMPIESAAAVAADRPMNPPMKKNFWDLLPLLDSKPVIRKMGVIGAGPMGGAMNGNPESITVGGKPYVFVRGTDDYVWWNRWEDSKWSGWESIGKMKVSSDPTAVVRKNGPEIWLFARGNDKQLWAIRFDGIWGSWVSWGGTSFGNPEATSWGGNRVDVFARNAEGKVLHAWRDDDEAIAKNPQWETLPDSNIINNVGAVGVQW